LAPGPLIIIIIIIIIKLPSLTDRKPTKKRVPHYVVAAAPATSRQMKGDIRLTLPHLPRVTHLSDTILFLNFVIKDEEEQRFLKEQRLSWQLITRGLRAMHWTSREGIIEQWRNEWFIEIQAIWFHHTDELLHAELYLEASERLDIIFSAEISRRDAILREYDRILHTLMKPHGALCRGISAETFRYRRQVVRAKLLAMPNELAHQRWCIEQEERDTRFHYNLLCEVGARFVIGQEEGNRRTAIETDCLFSGNDHRYQETMQRKLSLAIGFLTFLEQRFRSRRCGTHIVQHHDMLSHALQVDETMRRVALDRDNLFTMQTSVTAHCILFIESTVITLTRSLVELEEAHEWDALFRSMMIQLEDAEGDDVVRMHRFVLLSAHFDLQRLTERGADLVEFMRLTHSADRSNSLEAYSAQHELNRQLQAINVSGGFSRVNGSRAVRANQVAGLTFVEHMARTEEWSAYLASTLSFVKAFESEVRVVYVGEAISGLFGILEMHRKRVREMTNQKSR